MKQTARQTEAYDLAKGTLGREGEVGRLASQAQSIVPTILKCSTAARGTLACTTSTIAHVNATHPRPELDVVSVLFCLRTYHLCTSVVSVEESSVARKRVWTYEAPFGATA
jgi:hypothetical protein